MNESDFVRTGTGRWQRLLELTTLVSQSPNKLSPAGREEFIRLYKQTAADLARVRAETTNRELEDSLNQILAGAYSALYRRPPKTAKQTLLDVFFAGARAFRRQFRFVLLSVIIFFGSAFFHATVMQTRPDLRESLVPAGWSEVFESWKTGTFEERDSDEQLLGTAFYASNNPRVAVTAAAIGAGTFGAGSAYLMWNNGLLLGTLGWEMAQVGLLGFLLASIAPHGATELSGIFIAGAAGLSMGWALIAPGRLRRVDALRERAGDAFVLLVKGAIMMYIAAPFEGFFSFNPNVPTPLKAVVGGVIFAAWCIYWAFAGAKETEPSSVAEIPVVVRTRRPSAQRS